jgi:hypothetical protein
MEKKWIGLNIDIVPTSYFSSQGVLLMKEWKEAFCGK